MSNRTACSLFVGGLWLVLSANAAAQSLPPGQTRSSYTPRQDTLPAPVKVEATRPAPKIIPVQGVVDDPRKDKRQDPAEYVKLDPPGREKLFGTRETEKEIEERMRQEAKDAGRPDIVVFPEKPNLSTEDYVPRKFSPSLAIIEPSYVVYRRLYFEEKNTERYGWNLGFLQPIVSSAYFYKDLALFPHNFASYPHRRFETSAGECLPGSPVPYICYPPEITVTGAAAQAGLIIGFAAIVP